VAYQAGKDKVGLVVFFDCVMGVCAFVKKILCEIDNV
jgi:hypothetical protein